MLNKANSFCIEINFLVFLSCEISQSKKTIKLIWTVTTVIVIWSHVALNRNISYATAAIFMTFSRVLYPASISWMVLASHAGYGGIFAKIFNHPIFVHVNKLSYGIYLLNPFVINAFYVSQTHSTHVDPVSMVGLHEMTFFLQFSICFFFYFYNLLVF